MGKILSFPKEKTKRVHLLQKLEARRLFYSFSVFSVIVMAIVIGEKINSMNRPRYVFAVNYDQSAKLNRAVASQENVEFIEDIRWGQKIVQRLNEGSNESGSEAGTEANREPAAIGAKPDQYDQLRYGELAGKYRLTGTQGQKISEIEFVESEQVSEAPIRLRNREQFLTEHRELLAVSFEKTEVEKSSAQNEVYKLLNRQGQLLGKAFFQLDESGRFISLKVGAN